MKRRLMTLFIWLLAICLAAPAVMAETYTVVGGDSSNWNNNNNPSPVAGPTPSIHTHDWWLSERESYAPSCERSGVNVYYCNGCQQRKEETVPAKGHTWGAWQTTKEATCAEEGSRVRTCLVCQKTETQTIAKGDNHQWGDWKITAKATCNEKGKQERQCKICGKKQTGSIPKLEHIVEEWTVTKEPTCQKTGSREGVCTRCGKKQTEKLAKVDHDYEDWEITVEPTDFSKGKRKAVCRFCGKKKTEEFYPEGTLAKDLENDPDDVKEMQAELKVLGFFSGEVTGKFDKATVDAVKKAEKDWGLTSDGVGWPGFLRMLGVGGGIGGDGISEDPAKFKLHLAVVQTSPKKEYYSVGDELVYQWTLTNASTKKNAAKSTKIYHFNGNKSDKKKDDVIAEPGTLKVGESISGIYTYTVTKEDAISGKFRQGFIARASMGGQAMTSNKIIFVNAASTSTSGKGGWTPPAEESLAISKTVTSAPKNGSFYVKGETVKFRITVKNKTSNDVKDVIVTDALLGSDWKKTVGTLAGNDTKVYDVEYKVTAKDTMKMEAANTAVVSYTADGKTKMSKATAKAPAGISKDSLYIYKICTNTPQNGLFFVPGEEVDFEIRIINPTSKTTYTKLEIFDWLYSRKNPFQTKEKLAPGKWLIYSFSTKVTKMQAKLGKLTNSVMVSYRDPDQKKRISVSNECTVPCGLEGQDGVVVTKKIISTPENGSYYQEGEEIRFEINVLNNTVKDIVSMDIRDSLAAIDMNGYRTVQKGEKLAAGETYSIHFSYTVTAEDVENTKVTNMASAWWTVDTEYIETYSEPVSAPTAPIQIDRKLKSENLKGDACIPALTAAGDGVAQRDLTECEEHTVTAQDAEKLAASGKYEEAIRLWDNEISELYQEWEKQSAGEILRIAENEEAAYEHQRAALDASLALVCSGDEALAIALQERMEKCVDLCYELHNAPEERPDSLAAEHRELQKGAAEDACSRAVKYTEAGPARLVDDQCETHALTARITQALLETAEDDEEREGAWERIQGNWLLELNMMYDTWYLSAPAEQRAAIAADRMSFDELINARREALAVLYPDDPATAAEVLANLIMHRTELICQVLHEAGILTD